MYRLQGSKLLSNLVLRRRRLFAHIFVTPGINWSVLRDASYSYVSLENNLSVKDIFYVK